MSHLGEIPNKQIKPIECTVYEKEVIPDHIDNYIMMNKMMMEQHNYLMSFFPKPKENSIMKFLKKIFS